MNRTVLIALILIAGFAITFGVAYWPELQNQSNLAIIDPEQEHEDLEKTEDLLAISKPNEALKIIEKYKTQIENQSETGQDWLNYFIEASTQLKDIPQLVIIYEYRPDSFLNKEEAVILVGEGFISSNKAQEFEKLRRKWRGRETKEKEWFILDGDKFLVDGHKREAIDHLKSETFEGKEDTDRLLRLALLHVNEEPKKAWEYLAQAYSKDPNNPSIRTYRARLLESVGKDNLALSEYLAASQIDPDNIYLRNQIAEFYLRHQQYHDALQVWANSLTPPSQDFIWLKALFWSKVVTPIHFDWKDSTPPPGKLKPMVDYLISLKKGQFWNEHNFDAIPNGSNYLNSLQATFWLRLLQTLKDGNEKQAMELLQFNPFEEKSWDPELETAIKRILMFRKNGSLQVQVTDTPRKKVTEENHFFKQLTTIAREKKKIPSDLEALLNSDEAFSAAFLAAGWMEAALELNQMNVIPETFPSWVAYGLTQAFKNNRGNLEALQFASLQKKTPPLSLMIAELLIAAGSPDEGLDKLLKLQEQDTDVGFRAAWLASLVYIEKGDFKQAKKSILDKPKLSEDILGRETLARIALLEGDIERADILYQKIENESAEAKSYLARKAYAEKDWLKAKELTEGLLRQYPNNALLRDNLRKIIENQKNARKQ